MALKTGSVQLLVLFVIAHSAMAYDGFGMQSLGGLANTHTFIVSSLDNDGPGTLRDMMARVEALISVSSNCMLLGINIVFNTSGTISLSSLLQMRDVACVTLDGDGAINIEGGQVLIRDAAHVIVRGLRFEGSPNDGLTLWNVDKFVVANNSFRDAGDENLGIVLSSKNGSVLENLFSVASQPLQAEGMIVSRLSNDTTDRITIARNLFVDMIDRAPLVQGRWKQLQIANNLVGKIALPNGVGNGTRLGSSSGNIQNNLYLHYGEDDAVVYGTSITHHAYWFEGNIAVGADPGFDPNNPTCPTGSSCSLLPRPFPLPTQYQVDLLPTADLPCVLSVIAGAQPHDAHDTFITSFFNHEC